jgi:hypothetical protein
LPQLLEEFGSIEVVFGGDLYHPAQLGRSTKEAMDGFYESEQKVKNNMEHAANTLIRK